MHTAALVNTQEQHACVLARILIFGDGLSTANLRAYFNLQVSEANARERHYPVALGLAQGTSSQTGKSTWGCKPHRHLNIIVGRHASIHGAAEAYCTDNWMLCWGQSGRATCS